MRVDIDRLNTRLTLTGDGDLLQDAALERLVRLVAQRVLDELRREERRGRDGVQGRRVDVERY